MNRFDFLNLAVKLINKYKLHYLLGIILIISCVSTWILDLNGFVSICPYCRTQRTLLGIVGVMLITDFMLLHYIVSFYCIILGIDVGLAQVFLHVKKNTFPNAEFTLLAMLASYAFMVALLVIVARIKYYKDNSV